MNTTFLLLAEFGQADVPVEIVAARYLGLDERQAKRQASSASLPFPVFRPGSQKGPWLARILARVIPALPCPAFKERDRRFIAVSLAKRAIRLASRPSRRRYIPRCLALAHKHSPARSGCDSCPQTREQ